MRRGDGRSEPPWALPPEPALHLPARALGRRRQSAGSLVLPLRLARSSRRKRHRPGRLQGHGRQGLPGARDRLERRSPTSAGSHPRSYSPDVHGARPEGGAASGKGPPVIQRLARKPRRQCREAHSQESTLSPPCPAPSSAVPHAPGRSDREACVRNWQAACSRASVLLATAHILTHTGGEPCRSEAWPGCAWPSW